MKVVACVRCGRSIPARHADIVGNGYRCARCTALVQHGDDYEDVADNVDPATRERLARQGKRRFFGSLGIAGALLVVPSAIALIVAGPLAALGAGAVGLYLGSNALTTGLEIWLAQWRRYGTPPGLPAARIRKLPPGDG